ncbi:scoloptoxin SSD14-like isoform X1 [Daphnia pulex]|uniref:scoloptoxin SSD14-like isoform X1 n=1 Tax=Daphnia pulex TaxID=6669 RepID=UPI001EE13588|nr:scoloptoxin SSD14-like isoform X1 [Daphnia pulex]
MMADRFSNYSVFGSSKIPLYLPSKKVMLMAAAAVGFICAVGLALALTFVGAGVDPDPPFAPPSPSRLGKFKTAAVSSDGTPCSTIGRDVLADGGNAVDAAIATVFCIGAVNPQSAGIGGGFHMTLYDPVTRQARSLDAREVAPIAATEDMFKGNSTISQRGGLAVAVPGELAGYWAAHQEYGKLPWSRLVLPTAEMVEKGVPVNSHQANSLQGEKKIVLAEPSLQIFVNEKTGKVKKEGDIVKNPALAQTLRMIARAGVGVFYNGTLGDRLVEDIQRKGGIITKQDLMQYRPDWKDPIKVELHNNMTLYSMPPPGSGVLTAFILNILDGHLIGEKTGKQSRDPTNYHRIAEAFKHAYAQRTKLADPRFVPEVNELTKNLSSEALAAETYAKINDLLTSNDPAFYGAVTYNPDDQGTSHISVLDGNGMAVAITSTVNLRFGAGWISEQTGILMNDEMDDFSSPNVTNYFGVPPSPANFIVPGKRPLSSMTPTIIVNSLTGKVRSVIGAAGGTKITTATAYAIIRNLWFGETIKEAIDSPRMHHQLFPMNFQYENGFPMDIVRNMTARGHNVTGGEYAGGAVICGITVEADGFIYANSDWRKSGDVDGLDPVN